MRIANSAKQTLLSGLGKQTGKVSCLPMASLCSTAPFNLCCWLTLYNVTRHCPWMGQCWLHTLLCTATLFCWHSIALSSQSISLFSLPSMSLFSLGILYCLRCPFVRLTSKQDILWVLCRGSSDDVRILLGRKLTPSWLFKVPNCWSTFHTYTACDLCPAFITDQSARSQAWEVYALTDTIFELHYKVTLSRTWLARLLSPAIHLLWHSSSD